MSLISDALKTAQRERSGQAQAAKGQQPLIDGFFPYVSSTPPRSGSRLVPILAISGGAVVLLSVVGWLTLSTFTKSSSKTQPPIILPPPSVAQAPVARDSVVARAPEAQTTPEVETAAANSAAAGNGTRAADAPRRTSAPDSRIPVRTAEVRSSRTDTTVVPTREVVSTAPSPVRADPATSRVDYESQATALFNAGDLTGARDRFLLATRFAPTARAWTNYGVTLQKLGDFGGASAAYQSAIGVDANYLEAWLYQGRLAVELGDVAKAIPMFQRARAINPRHADVNVELARLESEAKNWTETRRFAAEAVRADPSNARAHWYLAVATDQLKDFEVAVREYAAYLQTVGAAEREQAQFVGWARQRLVELRGKP